MMGTVDQEAPATEQRPSPPIPSPWLRAGSVILLLAPTLALGAEIAREAGLPAADGRDDTLLLWAALMFVAGATALTALLVARQRLLNGPQWPRIANIPDRRQTTLTD